MDTDSVMDTDMDMIYDICEKNKDRDTTKTRKKHKY